MRKSSNKSVILTLKKLIQDLWHEHEALTQYSDAPFPQFVQVTVIEVMNKLSDVFFSCTEMILVLRCSLYK